jgi:hypothetical protein
MGTVIRTMSGDDGDGPEYRIHYEVTSPYVPAQVFGPPEGCYPAEGPEWNITCIECELWPSGPWISIEQTHDALQVAQIYDWAVDLDLSDEAVEDAMAERDAYLEAKGDAQREGLED